MKKKKALILVALGIVLILALPIFQGFAPTESALETLPGLLGFLTALVGIVLFSVGAGHLTLREVPEFVKPVGWGMQTAGTLLILLGLAPILILLQEGRGGYVLEWNLEQWSWTIVLSVPGLLFLLTPLFWPRAEEESG